MMKTNDDLTYRKFLIDYDVWLYILNYSKSKGIGVSQAAEEILEAGITFLEEY